MSSENLLLNALASFLIAVPAGLGVGGGGLLVLYLTLVARLPQARAQGLNLLFFLCAAGAALLVHRKKRTFSLKTLWLLAAAGAVFSLLGAMLATVVNHDILRKCFGALLLLSGTFSLFHTKRR